MEYKWNVYTHYTNSSYTYILQASSQYHLYQRTQTLYKKTYALNEITNMLYRRIQYIILYKIISTLYEIIHTYTLKSTHFM